MVKLYNSHLTKQECEMENNTMTSFPLDNTMISFPFDNNITSFPFDNNTCITSSPFVNTISAYLLKTHRSYFFLFNKIFVD